MSREYACTEDRFLKDAETHQMTLMRDDGVHRHIRFRRENGNGEYWFDIITWPGTLCIDGDMGTYVFRRLHDMFEFFRTDREYMTRNGNQLAINPGYWSEKLQAMPSKGCQEFIADSFRQRVKEAFDNWVESNKPEADSEFTTKDDLEDFAEQKDFLWDALESDVLSRADDGDVRAIDAAYAFTCDHAPDFKMEDCWEWRCEGFTFHFIWCCYAIAWGVKSYDAAKDPQP